MRSGSTPQGHLQAAIVASVGDDFIEHQKRTIGLGPVAHCGQKFWFDRIHTDTVGHGVQQHTGQLLGMFFKQFEGTLRVVEGEMITSLSRGGGGAVGHGDTIGSIRIAPDGGVGDLADFGVVVGCRGTPFDFGNLGASGERPGGF